MVRPVLEVADILREHGPAWRETNRGHLSLDQLKVMSAIERCRTAALGGHVARCENAACGHTMIAYNSCLMGKIRNGESMGVDIGFGGFRGLCGPHYERPRSMAMSLSGGRKEPSRDAAERWPLWLRVCWWDRHAHIFRWLSGWRASTRVIGYGAQTTLLREDRGVGCRSCLWGATRKGNAIGPCRTPSYPTPPRSLTHHYEFCP